MVLGVACVAVVLTHIKRISIRVLYEEAAVRAAKQVNTDNEFQIICKTSLVHQIHRAVISRRCGSQRNAKWLSKSCTRTL